jgi:hypothetical protein
MVFFLACAVIAWTTRAQPTVAFITAESEFIAAIDTGRLSLFIRSVINKLLQRQHASTTV